MKLKYKKIILIISISTITIGIITISSLKSADNKSNNVEVASIKNDEDAMKDSSESTVKKDANTAAEDTVKSSEDSEANGKKGDTSNEILQKDAYQEVNELVKNYLSAIVKCDMDALSKYVSDTNSIDLKTLQKQSEYIEDYRNIECYTITGNKEGSYVVYVYEELKIIGIDTLAPGMIRLYITTGDDGKLYITSGTTDDETSNFIDKTSKNEEVKKLINSVNLKLSDAIANDEDLNKFMNKISEITQKAEKSNN